MKKLKNTLVKNSIQFYWSKVNTCNMIELKCTKIVSYKNYASELYTFRENFLPK